MAYHNAIDIMKSNEITKKLSSFHLQTGGRWDIKTVGQMKKMHKIKNQQNQNRKKTE